MSKLSFVYLSVAAIGGLSGNIARAVDSRRSVDSNRNPDTNDEEGILCL